MKVLVWVSKFPLYSETFVRDHIVGLIKEGIDVCIHTKDGAFNEQEKKALDGFEAFNLHNRLINLHPYGKMLKLFQYALAIGIIVSAIFNGHFKYYWSILKIKAHRKPGRVKTLAFNIHQLLKHKIKIIHAHFGPNGNDAVIFKQLNLPLKLLVTFHGFDIRMGLEKGATIYSDLFEYADGIISISNYNTKHLLEFGVSKSKLIKINNGIDVDFFSRSEPNVPKDGIKLLTVARLVPEKALEVGIRAVAQWIYDNPHKAITYTIIGEGPDRESLNGLIDALHMGRNIFLTGFKNACEIRDAMINSHIFILSSRQEALPTVLLEAQAAEMCILATHVGSVKEMLPYGTIVEPGRIDALKQALHHVVLNQEIWSEPCQKAKAFVNENYNSNTQINQLISTYKHL